MKDILKARRFNTLLGFLIVVQAMILMIIASMLILPVISPDVQLLSAISASFLFFLCLPLSLYLYWTSTNKDLIALFLSMFITFFLLTTAAILWFFLPQLLDFPWLVPAGKALGISVYIPVLLTFLYLINKNRKVVKPAVYTFILFFNIISAITIMLLVAMNYYAGRSDAFSVLIYTISIILDITILSLGSMLAFTSMENQLRYVLSIPICVYLFSLVGDALSLLAYLGLYDTFGYGLLIYNGMAVFGGLALLALALCNVKVTTVEEVNKKLYDTKSLMSDLVMQSPDAICIFDVDGKAVLANNAFIQFTGKSQEDVIGKLNLFWNADELIDGSSMRMDEVRNGSVAVYGGINQRPAKDGHKKYYSIKIFPTFDSERKVTSYIAIMADITDSKKYEEELQAAKNEAELYLDLMSHDINNMDQIAMGFLEMVLERPDVNGETKELIVRPLGALESSTNLIRNVKKLQQIRGYGHKLYAMDTGQVLRDVIKGFSNVPGREVTITEDITGDCKVMANDLLSDVFSNIIGNAIKHSKGRIAINVYMDKVRENGKEFCRISIEDDGPGIPDEWKSDVFNRFQKGSARASGKGLGLYLVKTLVEMFQGRVRVEDRIAGDSAKGSRFVVMLRAVG